MATPSGKPVRRDPTRSVQRRVQIPDRMTMFLDGTLGPEDLDDEEIQRGQLRAKDGSFKGRRANYLPQAFVVAIQREQQRRFQDWISVAVPDAQKAVMELVGSKRLTPGDATRLRAAELILDRFAGKTPERVEVNAKVSKFENVLTDILVDVEEDEDDFK